MSFLLGVFTCSIGVFIGLIIFNKLSPTGLTAMQECYIIDTVALILFISGVSYSWKKKLT